jgi:hypothetical protein
MSIEKFPAKASQPKPFSPLSKLPTEVLAAIIQYTNNTSVTRAINKRWQVITDSTHEKSYLARVTLLVKENKVEEIKHYYEQKLDNSLSFYQLYAQLNRDIKTLFAHKDMQNGLDALRKYWTLSEVDCDLHENMALLNKKPWNFIFHQEADYHTFAQIITYYNIEETNINIAFFVKLMEHFQSIARRILEENLVNTNLISIFVANFPALLAHIFIKKYGFGEDHRLQLSLLHYYILADYIPGVQLLLAYGANVAAQASFQSSLSPLHHACATVNVEMINILLNHLADINYGYSYPPQGSEEFMEDIEPFLPLAAAINAPRDTRSSKGNHYGFESSINDPTFHQKKRNTLELLLNKGADVRLLSHQNYQKLEMLCQTYNIEPSTIDKQSIAFK